MFLLFGQRGPMWEWRFVVVSMLDIVGSVLVTMSIIMAGGMLFMLAYSLLTVLTAAMKCCILRQNQTLRQWASLIVITAGPSSRPRVLPRCIPLLARSSPLTRNVVGRLYSPASIRCLSAHPARSEARTARPAQACSSTAWRLRRRGIGCWRGLCWVRWPP